MDIGYILIFSAGDCGNPKRNNDVINVCTKIRCEFENFLINLYNSKVIR